MSSLNIAQQNKLKKLAALGSVSLAITLTLLKTVGVFYSGSLSVLSSLIDSLSDVFASGITYIAIRVSSQPADTAHRYGHGKAEALSSLVQSAFIAGSGIFVLYDGVHRLLHPRPLAQTSIGLGVMIVSLVLTLILISFQKYVAHTTKSRAIAADSAHYTVDVMTNLSIIATLVVVKLFDITWFDSVTAILISIYLLINAQKLAKDALALLMDKELSSDIREQVQKLVLSCDHVQGMHDLRTRDLGGAYMFELHLELDGKLSLFEAHHYADEVEEKIKQTFLDAQVIIHQDPAGLNENRLDNTLAKE